MGGCHILPTGPASESSPRDIVLVPARGDKAAVLGMLERFDPLLPKPMRRNARLGGAAAPGARGPGCR